MFRSVPLSTYCAVTGRAANEMWLGGLRNFFLVGCVVLCQNLLSAFQNRRIFNMHNAAVRAGFEVELYYLTIFVLVGAEVIADGLLFNIEFLGDASYTAVRKCVLDAAKFLECDIHKQKFSERIWVKKFP